MGKKEERNVWPTPVLQHTQFTPTPPPSSGRYMYIEDVSLSFAANGWRIKDQLIWLPKRKAFVCVCSDQKLGKFSFHCRDVRVRSFRLFGYLCGVGKIDTERKLCCVTMSLWLLSRVSVCPLLSRCHILRREKV